MALLDEIKERLRDVITGVYEHNPRRAYLTVEKQNIKTAAQVLFKELGLRFATASGIDTAQGLEIVYHFSLDKTGQLISIRTLIRDKQKPEIDSLTSVAPCFEWIEREMWELLGIHFIGHPNLKHLLLIDDWPEGKYPLRHTHES